MLIILSERTEFEILKLFISTYNDFSQICEACKYDFQQTVDEKIFKRIYDYQIKLKTLDFYIKKFAEDLNLKVTNDYCDTCNDDFRKIILKYNIYQIIE